MARGRRIWANQSTLASLTTTHTTHTHYSTGTPFIRAHRPTTIAPHTRAHTDTHNTHTYTVAYCRVPIDVIGVGGEEAGDAEEDGEKDQSEHDGQNAAPHDHPEKANAGEEGETDGGDYGVYPVP